MKNDKKKQHYVPKFYLKFFADDENKFYVYDFEKKNLLPNRVFYESQCYKKYLYGEDGILESKLSNKEGEWATVCKKAIEKRELLQLDIALLKEFIIYQKQRTNDSIERSRRERLEILREYAKMISIKTGLIYDDSVEDYCQKKADEAMTPAENVLLAEKLRKYVEDLGILVIHYSTGNTLITTDSPVVSLNSFMLFTGFGYDNLGVSFFLPLSPNVLLIMYDDALYGKYKNQIYVESKDEDEVLLINRYELIHADKKCFSTNKKIFDLVDEETTNYRQQEKERNKTHFLGPEDQQRLIITQMEGTKYYYELPYMFLPRSFHRIPYGCREAIPRHFEEGWDKKLAIKYNVFRSMNNIPKGEIEYDQVMPKSELRIGCKRMETQAKIYWQEKGYTV